MSRLIRSLQTRQAVGAVIGVAAVVFGAVAIMELLLRLTPLDPNPYLAADPSPVLLDRNGLPLHVQLNAEDAWCFPKPADRHALHLVNATIAAEDQRFYDHNGVDLIAVLRAALQNSSERQIASGASTITMQLVKLNDSQPRSIRGKMSQAWTALRLERATGKEQILAAYLNRAPYGYNLVGAEASSRRYFGKSSTELTLAEAATLAGLPKAPGRLEPLRHARAAQTRRDYVLHRMHVESHISDHQLEESLATDLAAQWHDLPMDAPHILARFETAPRKRTTIDGELQRDVQHRLKRYLMQFDGVITNAAAIVIDVDSAEVLAYCGSADFFQSDGGQMDLARAKRSPGSALKPFVYALALQNNRLFPSEMLLDDTLDFGDYNPCLLYTSDAADEN